MIGKVDAKNFRAHEVMKQRWGEYLSDFAVAPFDLLGTESTSDWKRTDPVMGYKKLAEEIGFQVLFCEMESYPYHFRDRGDVMNHVRLYSPVTRFIPEILREKFVEEFAGEFLGICKAEGDMGDFGFGVKVQGML